jgi:2-polyprenyl-6-methoxyphenol hydroxylase-like FAD-dependent oxidoreductase
VCLILTGRKCEGYGNGEGTVCDKKEHQVLISGGGPTGLMLAGELALAGVDVAILERRSGHELVGSRAGGLHSRGIEILDQRGIAEWFLAEGQTVQTTRFGDTTLDISDFPTRHPYGLGLWQNHIERILAEWVGELGVPTNYGHEVTGFAQDSTGVDVEPADGRSLRAQYLVGCDGGRSVVRKAAGIDFPGWEATTSTLIAEVEMAEEPEYGIRHSAVGISGLNPIGDDGLVRVVVSERKIGAGDEPTLEELSEALVAVYGTDFGLRSPTWISRFTDTTRQAASYREGRALLAGDSAHVHYPAGGQGLQHGLQDAVNLGWKLAQVVNGTSSDSLLDTYQAERHPPTARSLQLTMAQTALQRGETRIEAMRDTLAELMAMDEPRKHLAAQLAGLDVRYDLGDGHPLLGRRMPDLDLVTADGPLRVYTLLHQARPVLLNLGEPGAFDITPWLDRVQLVDAEYTGRWELPALGAVTAPSAVLIRPDGHVAWVGDDTNLGLADALTAWFGPQAR